MTDRGVSETLGFVLVFALVTGTIGIVYATGLSGLEDAQQEEKLQNVERAFDVLADNVADLSRGSAPSRATEVRLAGGAVETGAPVTFEIDAVNESNPAHNASVTVTVEPIVYRDNGGTTIAYTSGAVLRSAGGGAVMRREPEWVVGPDRSAVPFVDTAGSGGGLAGDGAVLIVAQRGSRTLEDPFVVGNGATARVNVTVTSPRAVAWKRFFEEQGYAAVDSDAEDDAVTYQFHTDGLYVSRADVEVAFNR